MGTNEGANAGLGLLLTFVNPWQTIDDGNLDFGAVADSVDSVAGSNGVVNSPYFGRTRGTSATSATGKQAECAPPRPRSWVAAAKGRLPLTRQLRNRHHTNLAPRDPA